MERRDGKDPFDAATYTSPATIKSMLELRAFCAAFFEEHIRDNTAATARELLDAFSNLICHSPLLFARARAVIPELQLHIPESEMTQLNPNIQRVLQVVENCGRSSDCIGDHLIEESAWTRLAKDGQEQFKKKGERIAKDLEENRAGHSGFPLRSGISTSTEPMEAKSATNNMTSPEVTGKLDSSSVLYLREKSSVFEAGHNKRSIMVENIPTFIPRAQMHNAHDLVWSPTSGTRQRKPEERMESQKRDPAVPPKFGQEISGNTPNYAKQHPILSSLKENTPEKRHGRGLSTSVMVKAEPYHSPTLPLAPARSPSARLRSNTLSNHRARNNLDVDPLPTSRPNSAGPTSDVGRQLSQTGSAYENAEMSVDSDSSNLRHPANRTPGIIDPGQFSAPPRKSDFSVSCGNDQGMYGRPEITSYEPQARHGWYGAVGSLPFQNQVGQMPYAEAGSPLSQLQPYQASFYDLRSPPFKPQRVQQHHSRPKRHHQSSRESQHAFAYPQQQSPKVNQSIQNPQPTNLVHQMQQPPYGTPTSESLIVAPPGSMHPVDYWNMLYQRSIDIHTRFANAGIPLTDIQRDYVARLGEARIAAVASKTPLRGQLSPIDWLDVLTRELDGLHIPGATPQTAVIVDRKRDYERAVRREIGLVEVELGIK